MPWSDTGLVASSVNLVVLPDSAPRTQQRYNGIVLGRGRQQWAVGVTFVKEFIAFPTTKSPEKLIESHSLLGTDPPERLRQWMEKSRELE